MNEFDEYEFWFDAFTPATIPMERLAKYLAALAKLMGNSSSVHFARVESGSTRPIMVVEREAAPKVATRLLDISKGDASNDAQMGFDELNDLLRDDNAIGKLHRKAAGANESALILRFAGKEIPRPSKYGPFTEPASVDGELVRVGGKDKTAHATIVDVEGRSWSVEVDRELAKQMAPYLFLGPILRVRGDARWLRSENGAWNLLAFKAAAFDVLDADNLDEVAAKLRRLRKTDWDSVDDIDGYITAMRGETDGLH